MLQNNDHPQIIRTMQDTIIREKYKPEQPFIPLDERGGNAGGENGTPSPKVKIDLSTMLLPAPDLLEMQIPPRKALLGEWLQEGDYGYIFAPRGHGKTWITLLICNSLSKGESLGEWQAGRDPRRVVYFDAEMALPDIKQRSHLLGLDSRNFVWLHHERIYKKIDRDLNIAERGDQESISSILNDGDIIIVDNMSTATSGIEENNGDHFNARIKPWIKELRNRRITVIIVHHAGKNGQMRGTSQREDMTNWILSLKDVAESDKTTFVTSFAKCRGVSSEGRLPLKWTLDSNSGRMTITCEKHQGIEAMAAMIRDGIGSAGELAEELNVTKGCVSKWAKKLMNEKPPRIEKKGRDYIWLGV